MHNDATARNATQTSQQRSTTKNDRIDNVTSKIPTKLMTDRNRTNKNVAKYVKRNSAKLGSEFQYDLGL